MSFSKRRSGVRSLWLVMPRKLFEYGVDSLHLKPIKLFFFSYSLFVYVYLSVQMKLRTNIEEICRLQTTPIELFQRWVDYWFCFLRLFSLLSGIPIIAALDRIQGVCVDQLPKTVMSEDFIKRFVELEDSIITRFFCKSNVIRCSKYFCRLCK